MGRLDRLAAIRREIRAAAAKRWAERTAERERARVQVEAAGPGAADSPQRQARFATRRGELRRLAALDRTGGVPFFIERKMGATLDFDLAPSEAARKAGRPVARIVELPKAGFLPEGFATGFLIAPGLLLTNNHVFEREADAVNTGANFLYERSENGVQAGVIFRIDPSRFFVTDPALDMTIVAVEPQGTSGESLGDFGQITLIEATPKILIGHKVRIIQYPSGGPKEYATTNNRLLDILTQFLHYETDTLEGSSGSPAFNDAWELVALHHAAIPLMQGGKIININGGEWDESQGDDHVKWIANEGTRVSVIVNHLSKLTLSDPARQRILDELLKTTTDPIDDQKRLAESASLDGGGIKAPPEGTGMSHNSFHFSGPVTIHVYAPQPAPVEPRIAPAIAAVEKVIQFDPDYDGREGYDPNFLSSDEVEIKVPTPKIDPSRKNDILNEGGKPLVLKYHHFELVMNRRRRFQMWSAVNVDYAEDRKSKRDRKEFGSDKWIPDPRIGTSFQISNKEFYEPAGNIDRGHMVRREDNAWGDTEQEIEYANSDTFHLTNCTPQHEAFNQSNPGQYDRTYRGMNGLWGSFENHVQKSRKGDDTKCCILAGPILDTDDPEADFGFGSIQYPIRFWKVICVADPDTAGDRPKLKAYGFILSQKDVVDEFGIERFDPGRFKDHMKKLTEIEAAGGVVFDPVLHQADQAP